MFWTLFVVMLLPDGKIDYSDYEKVRSFETRLECEIAKARILNIVTPPKDADLRCIRTDEA